MKKLAGMTFNEKEYNEIFNNYFKNNEHYIIRYKTIYQMFYSSNVGLYAQMIYQAPTDKNIGYTLKGRFIFANANFINKLVGFELLNI
jgi:hypothetical protein